MGAATFAAGQTDGPSVIAVFLRALWSIGDVKDRYLFLNDGADQEVGRVVACLPSNAAEFAVLPPHFTPAGLALLTPTILKTMIPRYELYPASFKKAIPLLVASVVYHSEYLTQNLDDA
jgi:hypothetical protein